MIEMSASSVVRLFFRVTAIIGAEDYTDNGDKKVNTSQKTLSKGWPESEVKERGKCQLLKRSTD